MASMPIWLTDELKTKIKNVFEPKYKRKLSDQEVEDIAVNLTSYLEHFLKFGERTQKKK